MFIKISIIGCIVGALLLIRFVKSDNPTAIVAPYSGPDPGYILAESDGGLSNRLRVLAAYMYIAEAKYEGAHLAFVWDVNEACPGHFLQVFEPIPSVIFLTNSSRYVLDKKAKIVYENSWAVFSWTLMMNNIPKAKFGQPSWGTIEYNMYSRFAPTREVMAKVDAFVQAHNICTASAMHLRVTDLAAHMARKRKNVNIHSYFAFVDSRPADEPVYLLTDNPDSQKLFLDKYGPQKIIVYSIIPPAETQKPIKLNNFDSVISSETRLAAEKASKAGESQSTTDADMKGKKNKLHKNAALSPDHRYTTLEHTLIDVLIAAHAKTFKAGMYSSLSDLVNMFSRIGKDQRGWCSGK